MLWKTDLKYQYKKFKEENNTRVMIEIAYSKDILKKQIAKGAVL